MAGHSSAPSDPIAVLFNTVLAVGLVFGTMVVFYEEPWNQVDAAAAGSDVAAADTNDGCATLPTAVGCPMSRSSPLRGHPESPAAIEKEGNAGTVAAAMRPVVVMPDPPADDREKERSPVEARAEKGEPKPLKVDKKANPGEAHAEKGETKPLKVDKKVNPDKESGEEEGQRKAFGKEMDKVAGGADGLGKGAGGKHDKKS